MFIMDESNVLEPSFLERMNTLLATGEVSQMNLSHCVVLVLHLYACGVAVLCYIMHSLLYNVEPATLLGMVLVLGCAYLVSRFVLSLALFLTRVLYFDYSSFSMTLFLQMQRIHC